MGVVPSGSGGVSRCGAGVPGRWWGGWGVVGLRLVCGSLAVVVAAACSGGGASAGSSSSPATTTWPVREFGVPDSEDFPEEGAVTVKFVTYGDVDPDDEVPFGVMPDVQIAVIREKESTGTRGSSIRHLDNWWMTVGGIGPSIHRPIPPGVRVQSTAEKLAAAPARFVTTGSDGTLEISIDHTGTRSYLYSFCVMSPVVDDLIAGCNHRSISLLNYVMTSDIMTVYLYFAYGYAIVEEGPNGDGRYQRFLDGEVLRDPAKVSIASFSLDDVAPTRPGKGTKVAIVDDAHVSAWWEVVLDERNSGLGMTAALSFDSEVLAHDWVRVVTTGSDGLAEIDLPSGDYLLCEVFIDASSFFATIGDCTYATLISNQNNIFRVASPGGRHLIRIRKMSEEEGELAIAKVKSLHSDQLFE